MWHDKVMLCFYNFRRRYQYSSKRWPFPLDLTALRLHTSARLIFRCIPKRYMLIVTFYELEKWLILMLLMSTYCVWVFCSSSPSCALVDHWIICTTDSAYLRFIYPLEMAIDLLTGFNQRNHPPPHYNVGVFQILSYLIDDQRHFWHLNGLR